MIREDQFVLSHRPYAVDLATVRGEQTKHPDTGSWFFTGTARAVWYRRQGGVTRACVGVLSLWSPRLLRPVADLTDPVAVLSANLDGRFGGQCQGRWDGERYWGAQEPEVIERHLGLLRPMLANFPTVPRLYDGWWTFREARNPTAPNS